MSFFDYVLADLETDGLKPSIIWMGGAINLLTGEYRSFVGAEQVTELVYELATSSRVVVGHNFRSYDSKVITDLTGLEIDNDKIVDTLEMSRRLCPQLPNHKLATWGDMFGYPKYKSPPFHKFTPEMVPYCERDVRLNGKMFDFLLELFWEDDALIQKIPKQFSPLLEYSLAKTRFGEEDNRQILYS